VVNSDPSIFDRKQTVVVEAILLVEKTMRMVRQTITSEKTARSDEDRASAFLSTTAAAC
jgi:hypothetical protein